MVIEDPFMTQAETIAELKTARISERQLRRLEDLGVIKPRLVRQTPGGRGAKLFARADVELLKAHAGRINLLT